MINFYIIGGFADVYQKPDGKVYEVYTEDNLPTVTSNRADKQCLTTYSAYFVIERINTLKEKI